MHILDLAQNSISAGARRVEIEVAADTKADTLTISIRDDGKGMPPEFLRRVNDPFVTTRRTRRVGLGIPMFAQAAKSCDGCFSIQSTPGKGTHLVGTFKLSHIDRAPLGNIASTLMSIMAVNPGLSLSYVQRLDDKTFVFDTDEVKEHIDGVSINEGPVLRWLLDYLDQQTSGDVHID